ncbi:biotin--[acetyl-CoA-carboxylase] ligase [Janibacter hoylei PVAS-1]|uniref:biotin--[biotin carboxyl-carrier protein] ligase n=1 Tax=Janibacter hoylei PVAS-1 TaxID=1210046 RepID=A0A444B8H4_9MICO|nr:biotin--[acetyl-CoA-carboxylase] ligase [Janibacter hoylei]RWU84637.1 biotin--[acetyl-CoA-carboxylase] ligase [Janibacter hoylei PVAS-1]
MLPPIDVQRLATALPTSQGWGEVHHLSVVGSTNVEAAERALVWSPVVAELQTAGRGRLGREWHEVPSAGLAMSVLVPLTPSPGWLPLVAGLAVRSALAEVGVAARLKWPNDVLVPGDDDRKVCGILCQLQPSGTGVVVGIGINVHHERADLPVGTATSLRLVGADVDRTDLAASVLGHLRRLHGELSDDAGAKGVRRAYREACVTLGLEVDLHRPDGTLERVTATGVDDDGRLVVDGPAGSATVAAGDVQHVRAAGVPPT